MTESPKSNIKIKSIEVSVFELDIRPKTINFFSVGTDSGNKWKIESVTNGLVPVQVIQVFTDSGIQGICTVGDWQYTEMKPSDLDHLRTLVIGENPLNRERIYSKLTAATRLTFSENGWFGGFDNCLWDIEGKLSGLPVAQLIGDAKSRCQAYYNTAGSTPEEIIRSGEKAVEDGYKALKDHLLFLPDENKRVFKLIRNSVGDKIELMHDAALADYTYEEALSIGRLLEELEFTWLEEPIPDRRYDDYVRLTKTLDIPIAGGETLMNDPELSTLWLKSKAIDILRVNCRHGTTPVLKLSRFAAMENKNVEPNSLGPLFGIVHAHLCCGISNVEWFETAPPENALHLAEEIGLLNPVVPVEGWVTYPTGPGWGAEWDWRKFEKNRIAVL